MWLYKVFFNSFWYNAMSELVPIIFISPIYSLDALHHIFSSLVKRGKRVFLKGGFWLTGIFPTQISEPSCVKYDLFIFTEQNIVHILQHVAFTVLESSEICILMCSVSWQLMTLPVRCGLQSCRLHCSVIHQCNIWTIWLLLHILAHWLWIPCMQHHRHFNKATSPTSVSS